jgi:acetylxylan esterase
MLLRSMLVSVAMAGLAMGASLQQVTSFGNNPTGINMYIYVPDKVAAKPAIIVAVSCGKEKPLAVLSGS